MAARYGGDPNSIDWRHFGRLAGFTNRKPQYVDEAGRYPFTKIDESTTKAGNYVNSASIRSLIAAGVQRLKQEKREQADAQNRPLAVRRARGAHADDLLQPAEFYQQELAGLMKRFGTQLDLSLADWTIGKGMAEQGYDAEHVMAAILEASPDLASRKSGHVENYINRTVNILYGQTSTER